MLGIALEGGGAKGAFHIGAVQACREVGLFPADMVAGTSIGALNAAMLAQGDFEAAVDFWQNISGEDVFSPGDRKLLYAGLKDINRESVTDLLASARALISAGGIDNTNMRAIIDRQVDPKRLMESPVDFGIVTVELGDMHPVEIFKSEMGEDGIKDYILASAAFPGFQRVKLGGRTYVDGGVYDNCPVNMLLERGCDRVIAVRTHAVGVTRYDDSDPRVTTIRPSEDLGPLIQIDTERARYNLRLGYYDALRVLMDLGGRRYYLTEDEHGLEMGLMDIPAGAIMTLAGLKKVSGRMEPRRLLFERILPLMFEQLELKREAGYGELALALIEDRAARCGIERLSLYTAQELLEKALAAKPSGRQRNENKAADLLLETLAGLQKS